MEGPGEIDGASWQGSGPTATDEGVPPRERAAAAEEAACEAAVRRGEPLAGAADRVLRRAHAGGGPYRHEPLADRPAGRRHRAGRAGRRALRLVRGRGHRGARAGRGALLPVVPAPPSAAPAGGAGGRGGRAWG